MKMSEVVRRAALPLVCVLEGSIYNRIAPLPYALVQLDTIGRFDAIILYGMSIVATAGIYFLMYVSGGRLPEQSDARRT